MKTRHLADSLGLPANWQAERYSTTVRIIRDRKPGEAREFTADLVLPYGNDELADLKARVAEIVAANA